MITIDIDIDIDIEYKHRIRDVCVLNPSPPFFLNFHMVYNFVLLYLIDLKQALEQ